MNWALRLGVLVVFFCWLVQQGDAECNRSFVIDEKTNSFLKDCKPFRYVSGSIHYFNVPYQLWDDRLQKIKAAGLNAIQTYVEWRSHQLTSTSPFDFASPQLNITNLMKLAQKNDLLVLLRLGPYIDAEREMGGLPWWLLQIDPNMKLRQLDKSKPENQTFFYYAANYYRALLKEIVENKLLYSDGGPVIMIQVENEYGSYPSYDYEYLVRLRNIIYEELGSKDRVVLYTTDGPPEIDRGRIEGVYATVDFGAASPAEIDSYFDVMKLRNNYGPLVNSEFYTGWLDIWGKPHQKVDAKSVCNALDYMLSKGANVNLYMMIGGTNFGFDAGGEIYSSFQTVPTSYDYDAPLTEAGDVTQKYIMIRDVISRYFPNNSHPVPPIQPKMEIPNIKLEKLQDLDGILNLRLQEIHSTYPKAFEEIGVGYGVVFYLTKIANNPSDPAALKVSELHDSAQVYVRRKEDASVVFAGMLSRGQNIDSMPIQLRKGDDLILAVENQGRVCYGSGIADRKGIVGNVTLNGKTLTNWTIIPDPFLSAMNDPDIKLNTNALTKWLKHGFVPSEANDGYGIYHGKFEVKSDQISDTFLKLEGFTKGYAFLNGNNLGRYWPIEGPQVTLYAPAPFFESSNDIVVFELEHASATNFAASFVKTPILDGSVPDI